MSQLSIPSQDTDIPSDMTPQDSDIKLVSKIAQSKFSVFYAKDTSYDIDYAVKVFPFEGEKVHHCY